jgi:hypothetical protein
MRLLLAVHLAWAKPLSNLKLYRPQRPGSPTTVCPNPGRKL